MKLRARRIVRISRVVSDLNRAEAFYRDALGFQTISRGKSDAVQETVMRLGAATVALVRFASPGNPYPADSRCDDLWFQHLAIVVGDIDAAYRHLGNITPITREGPQLLPPSNGGVRAFKFRDPDGHPLELICFPGRPAGPLFQDVDHSALAVSSTQRSVAFYRTLGMRVSNRSLNVGPAQDRLDALQAARVDITGLRPEASAGPGLELLGYHPAGRSAMAMQMNDTAVDWVTIEVATLFGDVRRAVRDPDGHRLLLVDQGAGVPD